MKKKVLVLGGTGAMGVYLVPELIRMGYKVDVVSFDAVESANPDLRYFQAKDAKDPAYIAEILKNDYDGIVDFMIYGTEEFKQKHSLLLSNTGHYIYLSSYRVYGNEEHPIRETSPRLLDCSKDTEFLATDDYSLHKARGEETLKASAFTNWTAIRPAITYSKRRFQLVILEADTLIPRIRAGKTVLLPREAMDVQATMSWGGDVAKMIARLLFNPAAYRDVFSVCTAEHNPWRYVADCYRKFAGLKYETVDKETFLSFFTADHSINKWSRWQLEYDRLFDRVMDNSKILNITGLKQSELMPLYDGLKREFDALPEGNVFQPYQVICDNMDAYLAGQA